MNTSNQATSHLKLDFSLLNSTPVSQVFSKLEDVASLEIVAQMVAFCEQEKADFVALLEFANQLPTKRLADNLIRTFNSSSYRSSIHLGSNNQLKSEQVLTASAEDFHKVINDQFWSSLIFHFRLNDILNQSLMREIARQFKDVDNEHFIDFNLENIDRYCKAIAHEISKDKLAETFRTYRHLFDFKFMKNGNLEIIWNYENVRNNCNDGNQLRLVNSLGLYKLNEIMIAIVSVDTQEGTAHPALRGDIETLDIKIDGVELLHNDKGYKLKLNPEYTNKFKEITAITPHTI